MALLGFFNELSMPSAELASEAASAQLAEVARSVGALKRLRPDFALQTQEPIRDWRLGRDLTFYGFLDDPQTKDLGRVLLGVVNRAPLRRDLNAAKEDDALLDYRVGDQPAEALGLANIYDGLVLSFNHGPWGSPNLQVNRSSLIETETGETELGVEPIDVRNLAAAGQVPGHRPWLDRAGKPQFKDFADFEANRTDRLANLSFLPAALSQFQALRPDLPRWGAVCGRLDELQEAVVSWDPNALPAPAWRSKVSGESKSRRKLCYFTDLDGEVRCFEEHVRFTPGMGRIYFRIDGAARKLVIAHIGNKIDS